MKPRLAIITSHPIQYNAPWFRLLSQRNKIAVKVFYTLGSSRQGNIEDPGFGRAIEWDIPLLEGYEYENVNNISAAPGTRNFNGIVNPALVPAIEKWAPSSILVFGWNFKSHLKCIRYFKNKVPVFFRGDSTLLNEQKGIWKLIRRITLTWVYRHIDIAFYVGQKNKDYFLKHGLQPGQLVSAPHAIDNDRFIHPADRYDEAAGELRRQFPISPDHLIVLYAGKFESVKNLGLLLEAAHLLKDSPISFILAGNGPLEKELKALAGENVYFTGFQNQQTMPVLYRIAHAFVLPSFSETWGLSVNEAMACSRAVIVSDRCGCATDLVEDGKNGYTFISGDIIDLVKKLKRLIENNGAVYDMGLSSFNIIQHFTFDKIAESIEWVVLKQKNSHEKPV